MGLMVSGPMALKVITKMGIAKPYLCPFSDSYPLSWKVHQTQGDHNAENELILEFPGPNLVTVIATLMVPVPVTSVIATYQANVTLDFVGAMLEANSFAQINAGVALLASATGIGSINVDSESNITIGTLNVAKDVPELSLLSTSHGIIEVGDLNAEDAEGSLKIWATNQGMVVIDRLRAPNFSELHVRAHEQGHAWIRHGVGGRANVWVSTGSIA